MLRYALLGLTIATMVGCGTDAGGPPAVDEGGGNPAQDAPRPPEGEGEKAPGAEPEEKGPFPFVLMHGMGGFVETQGAVKVKMFTGVAEDLTKNGHQVFQTTAPAFDTSAERSKMIMEQIETILKTTGAKKVNLIGHSQGGLDARYIASPGGLGQGKKIASITTVATPHLGSGVADFALKRTAKVPDGVIDKGSDLFLGIAEKRMSDLDTDPSLRAQVEELSTANMKDVFNPKVKDDPGVRYYSWAGRTNKQPGTGVCDGGEIPNDPNDVRRAPPNMLMTVKVLEEGTGKPNDGLVTVENAKWGKFQGCVATDHNGFVMKAPLGLDPVEFYRGVVARVRKDGL